MEELSTPSNQSQEPGLWTPLRNLAVVVLNPVKEMNQKAPAQQAIGRLERMWGGGGEGVVGLWVGELGAEGEELM